VNETEVDLVPGAEILLKRLYERVSMHLGDAEQLEIDRAKLQ
jgi:hypothetical protein